MLATTGLWVLLAAGLAGPVASAQDSIARSASDLVAQAARLDLAGAFHTRSAWRLVVTQGPATKDYGDNDAPGVLGLCLRKAPAGPCLSGPVTLPLRTSTPDDPIVWEPHYLLAAKVVYPRGPGAAPLLLVVTGSLYSGDGDQIISTQLIGYDAAHDMFKRVYGASTGHNNNQEIRFVGEGRLRGSVVTAEPQEHLPYGYWISVDSLTPAGAYRRVLRYRSATLYNDGNPLSVIDSEMPNIQKRLGLWKPGQPPPTPDRDGHGKPCLKPTLRHTELWCG